MKYSEFTKLLSEFEKLEIKPQANRRQTFMTVSGYPHIENVASNILAFLFNDTEEHGLENLWLMSLLECVGYPEAEKVSGSWCNREVNTIKGNRIDLVIYSDSTIVTLENKLFSFVHNDLTDYSHTISKIAKSEGLEQVDILLTLFDEHAIAEKHHFFNVTYSMLFEKVRSNLGSYMENADNTWLLYMKDFMYTIEGLINKGQMDMDKEFARFIYENQEDFTKLMYKVDSHKRELKKETEKICGLLELDELLQGYKHTAFCYNTKTMIYSCICIDITRENGQILTVETFVDVEGWHVTLFDRRGKESGKLAIQKGLNDLSIPYTITPYEPDKMQIAWCEYGSDTTDILNRIYDGVKIALRIL